MTGAAAMMSCSNSYTIHTVDSCRIVFGRVPPSNTLSLLDGYSVNVTVSLELAARTGASFVIGEPADIERLALRDDLPVSPEREADAALARRRGLPAPIVAWLRSGERDAATDAMCKALYGIPERALAIYPHDANSLAYCFRFAEQVTIAGNSDDDARYIAKLSPEWAALMAGWTDLKIAYLEDMQAVRNGLSAPRTNELLRTIIRGAVVTQRTNRFLIHPEGGSLCASV